jgi:hypothetical protein
MRRGSHVRPSRATPYRKMPLKYRTLGTEKEYARFYGLFETHQKKVRRFSFQVRMDKVRSNRLKYQLVKATCGKILRGQIPVHKAGEVFETFGEVFRGSWVGVKRVLQYQVGVKYGR